MAKQRGIHHDTRPDATLWPTEPQVKHYLNDTIYLKPLGDNAYFLKLLSFLGRNKGDGF